MPPTGGVTSFRSTSRSHSRIRQMFTVHDTWEHASPLQQSRLRHSGLRRYRMVDVSAPLRIFYVELSPGTCWDSYGLRKYLFSSLVDVQEFVASQSDFYIRVYCSFSDQEKWKSGKIHKILSILDIEGFEILFFQFDDGTVYLDGAGQVDDIAWGDTNILWRDTSDHDRST